MMDWKQMSIPEIVEKWNAFINSRNFKMEQNHPDFISIDEREWLIIELLNRFQTYIGKPQRIRKTKNAYKNVTIGLRNAQKNHGKSLKSVI